MNAVCFTGKVTLPAWTLPGVSQRSAKAHYTLPTDSGPYTVTVNHLLNGKIVGGMTFTLYGPSSIPKTK